LALPRKIRFVPLSSIPEALVTEYRERNRRLGVPRVGASGPAATPLAVVGGSPGLECHLAALRAFDGEIWAINGTWRWLRDRGIDATFYTIDPHPNVVGMAEGVERAILADTCGPALFEALAGASVELAELGIGGMPHGCATASTAPMIAAARGHTHVTFYGVDCSFTGQTHADRDDEAEKGRIRVEIGGEPYMTRPDLLMQAEELAELARALPGYITVVGYGLLPALIAHGDYDITHVSRDVQDALRTAA
jgi:hypothetical protein